MDTLGRLLRRRTGETRQGQVELLRGDGREYGEGETRPRPPRHAHGRMNSLATTLPGKPARWTRRCRCTSETMRADGRPGSAPTTPTPSVAGSNLGVGLPGGQTARRRPSRCLEVTLADREGQVGPGHPDTCPVARPNLTSRAMPRPPQGRTRPCRCWRRRSRSRRQSAAPTTPRRTSPGSTSLRSTSPPAGREGGPPLRDDRPWLAEAGREELVRADMILGGISFDLIRADQHAAAEGYLRESLKILEKNEPETLARFNVTSLLGDALLGQKLCGRRAAADRGLRGDEGADGRDTQARKSFAARGRRPDRRAVRRPWQARRGQAVAGKTNKYPAKKRMTTPSRPEGLSQPGRRLVTRSRDEVAERVRHPAEPRSGRPPVLTLTFSRMLPREGEPAASAARDPRLSG